MSRIGSAVVAGHICLDVIPDLSGFTGVDTATMFRPGTLLEVGGVTFSTGGAVSNTGISLHKLGITTRLMGKVGDDLFGRAVRQIVSSYGADLSNGMTVDRSVNTSYTIIISPPQIDRVLLHCPDANNTFGVDSVQYEIVSRADLFHFGYPPLMKLMYVDRGRQLIEIFRRVKGLGITTSLDMSLPDPVSESGRVHWKQILTDVLSYVDVFLPSIEECLYMLRPETYKGLMREVQGGDILPLVTPELLSDVSRELVRLGAAVIGLKLGERGFYLRTASCERVERMGKARPLDVTAWAEKELWSAPFIASVVGTTGSGDASIAGFLAALLRGLCPEEALTSAVAVGACNVEAADALSGVRGWQETQERIADGWTRHTIELDSPGWYFDRDAGIWRGPAAY